MIPLKLNINNFLCYGENVPTLDFQGIQLACLCGQNGHGKTAILEAITWCLWGKGRAQTQQEFVRIGQKTASVELEFECRGNTYKVSRIFSRPRGTGTGKTSLEIRVGSIPLTGNTIVDTQKEIDLLLNMDYRTFINTSYLKQGEADIFATSKPNERKQILANILSLSSYDLYETDSKKLSAGFSRSAEENSAKIAFKAQEVESFGNMSIALESIESRLSELDKKIERESDGFSKISQVDSLDLLIDSNEKQVQVLHTRLAEQKQIIHSNQDVISRKNEIEEGFSTLESLKTELGESIQKDALHRSLQERRLSLEKTITAAESKCSAELSSVKKNIHDYLEPKAKLLAKITEDIQNESQDLSSLESNQKTTLKKLVDEKNDIDKQIEKLVDENTRLRSQHQDIRSKFKMLESKKPICPLCEQSLSHGAHSNLRTGYEDEGRSLNTKHKGNESNIKIFEKERDSVEKLIEKIKISQASELKERQNTLSMLNAEKQSAIEAQHQMTKAAKRAQELQTLLETKAYSSTEFSSLKSVELEIERLSFDPLRIQSLNAEIEKNSHFELEHGQLKLSIESLPKVISSYNEVKTQAEQIDNETNLKKQERFSLEKKLSELYQEPLDEINSLSIQSRLYEIRSQRENAFAETKVAREQIQRQEQLSGDITVLKNETAGFLENKIIYDELSAAFGKNGVQALLIENALPQLQNDADRFLKKLTDGKLSIKFQLLQGKRGASWKLGIPSEDLEILISDETGTRSYETFSGGESFRINFAVRIALSQLLANLSGVGRTILFIDEGFGSQDKIGQELLVEVLQAIKSDFDKILVVTHIEDIKEAFPTKIEVEKTESGSRFSII